MSRAVNPPGPGFWEAIQVGRRFEIAALETLSDWHRRFGDITYFQVGGLRFYWLFHPELAHEVLVTQAKKFRRAGRQIEVLREWNGEGLVTSDGDFWLRQRRLVQPAFHPNRFARYGEQMVSASQRLVDRWRQDKSGLVEINSAMTELTMEIAASTFFGAELSQTHELVSAVSELSAYTMRQLQKPFSWPNWLPLPGIRRKLAAIRYLNNMLDQMVSQRRALNEDRGDLLSMLLQSRDVEGDGKGLADEQVRHQLMTLFLAGHDTTAGALPWVFYLLAKHPEVEARVRDELAQVLQHRSATAEDASRLTYTTRVVKETLRLYPQAYVLFARVAAVDFELGGYRIPSGSQLYVVPYIIHHDPRWHAEPERFDPERFVPDRFEQLPNCAWIPFGAGPRVCIGAAFATLEMVLVVATILQGVKLTLLPKQPAAIPHPTLSLRPEGWLPMYVKPIS